MKYIRFIAALLLLPLLFYSLKGFFDLLLSLTTKATTYSLPFWAGLIGYFIFQSIFFKPIRTYVFGHELTHAIVGLLSGASLKGFRVSASGGSVKLTKTNIWITLAPYFIPFYTIIILIAYWAVGKFTVTAPYYPYFLFAAGFSLSFHFNLTYYAVMQGQSDLERFGVFYSAVFILLINCILLSCLLELLFPSDVNLKKYFFTSASEVFVFWQAAWSYGRKLWNSFPLMK